MKTITELTEKELFDLLSDAKKNTKEMQEALSLARSEESDLMIEHFSRKTGLRTGIEIIYRGKPGIVSKLAVKFGDVRSFVKFFKKDGTIGERETELYNWDLKYLFLV